MLESEGLEPRCPRWSLSLGKEKLAPCPADDRDGGQARSGLTVLDERPGVQFRHGLPQLFLRVHDNWAVPRNGFLNRLS